MALPSLLNFSFSWQQQSQGRSHHRQHRVLQRQSQLHRMVMLHLSSHLPSSLLRRGARPSKSPPQYHHSSSTGQWCPSSTVGLANRILSTATAKSSPPRPQPQPARPPNIPPLPLLLPREGASNSLTCTSENTAKSWEIIRAALLVLPSPWDGTTARTPPLALTNMRPREYRGSRGGS